MKYERGEQVRVKDNFAELRFIDDPQIDPKMLSCAGKIFFITRWHNETYKWYKLENNQFIWDERWLEPVENNITMTENDILNMFKE